MNMLSAWLTGTSTGWLVLGLTGVITCFAGAAAIKKVCRSIGPPALNLKWLLIVCIAIISIFLLIRSAWRRFPTLPEDQQWIVIGIGGYLLTLIVVRPLLCFALRPFGLLNLDYFCFWVVPGWRSVWRLGYWLKKRAIKVFGYGGRATASWAGFWERASLLYRPSKMFFGVQQVWGFKLIQPIGQSCKRHFCMFSGTGSGKTIMLATILSYSRSNTFTVDPSGQLFSILRERFSEGGKGVTPKGPLKRPIIDFHEEDRPLSTRVLRRALAWLGLRRTKTCKRTLMALDPTGIIKGYTSACWNPLDELCWVEKTFGRDAVARYALRMAGAFIEKQEDSSTNKFFPINARIFVQALILFVYVSQPKKHRHIVMVRDLLMRGLPPEGPIKDPFKMLHFEMQQRREFNELIRNASIALMTSSDRAAGDILATARGELQWLDDPSIRRISCRSDFSLAELKTEALSLFVCASTTDIKECYAGWFRTLTVVGLYHFECIPGGLKHPCIWALDELPSMGRVSSLEVVAPVLRKYGVQLIAISQAPADLKQVYPGTASKFIGNADAVFWLNMAQNDMASAKMLSEILGSRTRLEQIGGGDRGVRYQKVERPLLYPEQVPSMLEDNLIVTRYDGRPLLLKPARYFETLPVSAYSPDPEYRESICRSLTRLVLRLVKGLWGRCKQRPKNSLNQEE